MISDISYVTPAQKIKIAHVKLLGDRRTYAIAAAVLIGDSKVVTANDMPVPTACTDGVNKFYNDEFVAPMTQAQVNYLVMHENLHVFLQHVGRHDDLRSENPHMANVAMDYVVNGIIEGFEAPDLFERPTPEVLYDPMFDDWDVRSVYAHLMQGIEKPGMPEPESGDQDQDDDGQGQGPEIDKSRSIGEPGDGGGQGKSKPGDEQGQPSGGGQGKPGDERGQPGGGQGEPGDEQDGQESEEPDYVEVNGKKFSIKPMDGHDHETADGRSVEDQQIIETEIRAAIIQAGIMAGAQGAKIPRAFKEAVAPEVDWRAELQEFVELSLRGDDDVSFRRYDRRYVTEDIFYPTVVNENVEELVLAMDTSSSTFGPVFDEFVDGFKQVLAATNPGRVRVLHWDTSVKSEQVLLPDDYTGADMHKLLKPIGGGGTHVSSVAHYIRDKGIEADVVVVFTDGYIESDISWPINIPTLWLMTRTTYVKVPDGGRLVKVKAK